jgi:hypothetical protein
MAGFAQLRCRFEEGQKRLAWQIWECREQAFDEIKTGQDADFQAQ